MLIKQVSVDKVLPVRQQVLRKGKSLEACYFEGDTEKNTYHLGVFLNYKLAGICTIVKRNQVINTTLFEYQLRGMAVLDEFQQLKIGKSIMEFLPGFLKEKKINKIWCNARVNAIGFYEKFDFKKQGSVFVIPDVGPHILMYKVYA